MTKRLRTSGDGMYQQGHYVPGYLERKDILYRDPSFQPNTILTLNTENRSSGNINNPTWNFPLPIRGTYAVSLHSLTIPVTWPNVTTTKHFEVEYGEVTPYVGDLTVSIGRYSYNPYIGTLTFATVAATDSKLYQDDLMYYIMRNFNGAVESIYIDPSTGVWTWVWDPAAVTVTTTSTDALNFFKITSQIDNIWQSSGFVDLTGPKCIIIDCNDLASGGYATPVAGIQSYLCSAPVTNVSAGEVLTHVPVNEKITFFGTQSKFMSRITLGIIDPVTNTHLPLQADWCVELKLYVSVLQ